MTLPALSLAQAGRSPDPGLANRASTSLAARATQAASADPACPAPPASRPIPGGGQEDGHPVTMDFLLISPEIDRDDEDDLVKVPATMPFRVALRLG